jgi:ubiquinone/menaquinone biosynthesis C-methylase UbiE
MTALNPAQAYEQLYVPAFFRPIGNALLDRLEVSAADRVVDVACGTGIIARLIHGRVGSPKRLDGIDINPVMVAAAQTFAPFAETRLGDATTLPYRTGDFDAVLCQHGLMFFPDRAKALAEMRRVLSDQGRLGITTWRPLSEHPLNDAIMRAGRRHVDAPIDLPFSLGDADQLRTMIETAGFGDIRIDTLEFEAHFPDAGAFMRMNFQAFAAVLPRFAMMNEAEREAFIGVMEAETADVIARHRDGNGVRFPVRANVVRALARGTRAA